MYIVSSMKIIHVSDSDIHEKKLKKLSFILYSCIFNHLLFYDLNFINGDFNIIDKTIHVDIDEPNEVLLLYRI